MLRTLISLSLAGLLVCACKPTQRTVVARPQSQQQQDNAETQQQAAPQQEQQAPQQEATPVATLQQQEPLQPEQAAEPAVTPEASLLQISLTRQGYNRLTPWEKEPPVPRRAVGTYLGNGLVLTTSHSMLNTTYAELSLPDDSRTVPARVVHYDSDLGLGLLTVAHEEDATIFDTRKAYAIGEPLTRGDSAELWCTLNGTEPLQIPLHAQVGTTDDGMPRLSLRAEQAVPDKFSHGAPIMKDGKLVGLSAGYEGAGRKLTIINAELLRRFMAEKEQGTGGVPTIGIELATLDDPVFRRYLKLPEGQTGVYVSKVIPMSAAAGVGITKGDVITAVEGISIDNQGRCDLPLYGLTPLGVATRYIKPLGQELNLTISHEGETREVAIPLNKDSRDKALLATEKPDAAPRYLVWGGMVFQPLTATYMQTLKGQARGNLPVEFQEIEERESELRERGYTELTALTLVIPTPATLGYENVNFCVVEKINGREVHNFKEFAEALDAPTENGLVEFTINKPPYNIYMEREAAEATNDNLRRSSVPNLRRVE